MGSKLHGICNLLTSFKNCCNVATVGLNTSDTKNRLINILRKRLFTFMEGFLEHYNRDYVRNTMIKHEEIFRHQVHELHRLYRVQKMLMAELGSRNFKLQSHRNANSDTTDWISLSTSETCHISYVSDACQSTAHMTSDYRCMLPSSNRPGLSPRELMVCSEDPRRALRGFDLEQPAEELSSTEAWTIQDQTLMFGKQMKDSSKFKRPHPWPDDESDIQLTLSIACGTDRTDFSASKY